MSEVVTLERSDVARLRLFANRVQEMLENRDLMNAAVHCQDVRWSPLTLEAQEVGEALARASRVGGG
jgi:hypothetical protein